MTMLRLRPGQHRVLIDRLPELANFIVGSPFFGQFLIERPFSYALGTTSIGLWVALMAATFWLAAGEE